MDDVLTLYDELNNCGVRFYHWAMDGEQASTIELNGRYAVFMDFDAIHTSAEELALVAHEGGHIKTGATHKLSSPYDLVEKHEYKANKWAIQRLISKTELEQAVADGCADYFSLAERFNVPEDFMRLAVCWYTNGNLAADLYL